MGLKLPGAQARAGSSPAARTIFETGQDEGGGPGAISVPLVVCGQGVVGQGAEPWRAGRRDPKTGWNPGFKTLVV